MNELPLAWPISCITADYPAFQPGESRVAQRAVLWAPCYFIVMAGAAEFSIQDVCHEYIVGSCAHSETDFSVAYIAFEANAMKPVREDYRTYT